MEKRLSLFFALLLACACLILMLTACEEDEHTHTPNSAVREKEMSATCTSVGSYDEVVCCSDCGEEISRITKSIEKLPHTPSDWITDTEATCKLEGKKHKECTVCHTELETSKIDKLTTHTPADAVRENEVNAKCDAVGSYDEVVYCSLCDAELSREEKEIAKLPHTEVTDVAKAPSCTETGLTEGKHCSVCNEVLTAQETVKANGHTDENSDYTCDICATELCIEHEEEIIPAVSATCTESGLTEGKKCSICGDILVAQETVKANGHTDKNSDYTCDICATELCTEHEEEIIPAVSATCTESGLTEGKKCSICGNILVAQETVKANGHTKVTDKAIEPTCTETGLTEGEHCSVCNEILVAQETIKANGHTKVVDKAVAPTCTETGLTEGEHCSVCNEILVVQETVKANGHTKVTDKAVAPTCTKTGLTEGEHCSVCNEILVAQETVKANGHTKVTDKAVEPTCTETGLTEGEHCSVCNEILVVQETVKANGHTDENSDYTCDICTTELCTEHEEEIIPAISATCTKSGLTEGKKCSICGDILVAQETVKANGHTKVTDKAVEPTCTETGLTEGEHCSVCNEILVAQETVKANGHTKVTDKAVAPTCTETGLTEGEHCSVCNEILVAQETVKANGHTKVTDKAVEPTCTETGLTEGEHCSVCNEILIAQETVKANGHTKVTDKAVAPTCTETGLTEGEHCSVCNEILVAQETVKANGHTKVTDKAVAPTCTETGLTEGEHCSVCNTVIIPQEVVDKLIAVESISFNTSSIAIEVGETFEASISFNPANPYDKTITLVSSDSNIALVQNGIVIGINPGTTQIIAISHNGKTAICPITVSPKTYYAESVTITGDENEVGVNKTLLLKAYVSPDNTTDKKITWTVSDPSVASVSSQMMTVDGVTLSRAWIKGLKDGTVTITATASNGISATYTVTVKTYYAQAIILDKTAMSIIIGSSHTLTATIVPSHATDQSVTWSSSDETVATVTQSGKVTALLPGTATITATTSNGLTASTTVSVYAIPVTDITFDTQHRYVDCGSTIKMSAVAYPSNATVKDLVWSSSDTNVATVKNGTVTTLKDGSVTITVSSLDGSVSKSCTITVENSCGIYFTTYGDGYAVGGILNPQKVLVIPKTYKGKPVTAILAGGFSSSKSSIIEEIVIGDNITYIDSSVKITQSYFPMLKLLISPSRFGNELFEHTTMSLEGKFTAISYDTKTAYNGIPPVYFKIEVPSADTNWYYVPFSKGYYIEDYKSYFIDENYSSERTIVYRSEIAEWENNQIYQYNYAAPTKVRRSGYLIPKLLYSFENNYSGIVHTSTPLHLSKTNICVNSSSNIELYLESGIHTLKKGLLTDFISPEDAAKLKTVGIHTVTVNYYGYTQEFTITVSEYISSTRTENSVPATCTESGSYDTVTYCSSCREILNRETVTVSAKGHSPKSAVEENRVEPTCTETGSYDNTIYCSVCNDIVSRETVTIPATGHSFNDWTAIDDLMHTRSCTNIGCTEIDESAHNFNDWIIDAEPTCISEGERHHVCRICSRSVSEAIPMAEHIYSTDYTSDENYHWYECTNDNCSAQGSKQLHSWNNTNICVCGKYDHTLVFTKYGDTYRVSGYTGNATAVIIPSTYNGLPVKGINESAFINSTNLISVTIPDSVTSIGYEAFEGCTSLTSIEIPDSVTSIGFSAFEGCTSLTSIEIPDSVTSIGFSAFNGCTSLTSIEIPDGVTSIGMSAFKGCTSLTSVTIGSGVTSIDSYAFAWCDSLTSVTIGNSVTSIGSSAFYNCTSLTSVTIGNSVTSIGSSAFYNCTSLTSVTIGNSVTSIGSSAFQYCESLTSIEIPNSVTSIGSYAFYNCDSLTSVTIGSGVTSIDSYAFAWCDSLTSVTIGNSVTSIGSSAFADCSSLTSIEIPDSVTSIGMHAFNGCTSLTSVTIGNSVTSIDSYAFAGCTSLTSIVIPDSVTSIGSFAFYKCTNLTKIAVDENNTYYKSINGNLYSKNGKTLIQYAVGKGDTGFTIPDGVTSIGDYAFFSCRSLTSIGIPDDVISIGSSAFEGCRNLTSIEIPNSVTSIDSDAFYGCFHLASVTFENPSGWSAGDTSISSEKLQDEATAAKYLKNTYYSEKWTKE